MGQFERTQTSLFSMLQPADNLAFLGERQGRTVLLILVLLFERVKESLESRTKRSGKGLVGVLFITYFDFSN